MVSILDWKNERKLLQESTVNEFEMVLIGFKSLLTVEKRAFWLLEPVWMRLE